ncbi:MAG TPA: hypothetical protein VMT27_08670, partial [Actinomycetes bacterium]|nr:hypothetical protein [Actinomycetes bacterium]
MSWSPPDAAPCWKGGWTAPTPVASMWAFGATSRTVDALPRLHPWRLGDTKGTQRVVLWLASSTIADGLAAMTETAWQTHLPLDDAPSLSDLPSLTSLLPAADESPRWIGGLARISGSWLPPMAV